MAHPRGPNIGRGNEHPEDALIRLSTDSTYTLTGYSSLVLTAFLGAVNFVEAYYRALQHSKRTIASFYVPPVPGEKPLPRIVINGNELQSGAALQEIFEKQLPQARYRVLDCDCSIINPEYPQPGFAGKTTPSISMVVIVSGSVKFGDEPERTFSETFVLVPNHDSAQPPRSGRDARNRPRRDGFLIQSQNFRTVALHHD